MSIAPMAGPQHVVSPLMRGSLMDRGVLARTETTVRPILPHLNVVQIGGLSIMDRGQSAVMPLLDEIVANQAEHTQVVGVGPGGRARLILSVGLDLGLPTDRNTDPQESAHTPLVAATVRSVKRNRRR
jgi:molybdenum storage protein